MKRTSHAMLAATLIVASACASAPPIPPAAPASPQIELKTSWILRLEDQRVLRDPALMMPPQPPAASEGRPPVVATPPPPIDLLRLLQDGEARTRRRAALAVGRVGLSDGVQPLVAVLKDVDPEVRQMAAFALGLIGDRSACEPLVAVLADPAPLVRGSAAEALGLIGDATTADAIGRMALEIVESGVLAELPSDAEDSRRDTPAAAYRLALYALARLKAYEPLSAAALDGSGQPRARWWPLAFALQRIEDPRAFSALMTLARDPHPYTRAFAAKGLGPLKNNAALPVLLPMVTSSERAVATEAIRSLGQIGDPAAVPALLAIVRALKSDPHLRLEAVTALAGVGGEGAMDALLDTLADPTPSIRAAAIRGLAQRDPEGFVTTLSGLDPDKHWSVRVALATALGGLTQDSGLPRLRLMIGDSDHRVVPAVLASLARLHAPDGPKVLLDHLKNEDPVIRAAAAAGLGELKPASGASALAEAYKFGQSDVTYVARAAAITALAAYGPGEATPVLTTALADNDWAVRVRAASLLKQFNPASDVDVRVRPAPAKFTADFYETPSIADPPVSTQVYIETDRGLIHIEMAVLDAPLTVENFLTLARKKFFDGLTFHRVVSNFVVQSGDPQGDGEGGPGYTIRDERNQRPYLRGTVGMALDWQDTGGSQFFITHSPQPHLDARYTVFGRVLSGMEIVDQIQPWEVIRRVITWDGQNLR